MLSPGATLAGGATDRVTGQPLHLMRGTIALSAWETAMTLEISVTAARPVAVEVAGVAGVEAAVGAEEGENEFEPLLRYENFPTCIHWNRPAALEYSAGI